MEIISPNNSFVQFPAPVTDGNCCDGDNSFCIPVINENDTWFAVKVIAEDLTEAQAIWGISEDNVELMLLTGIGNIDLANVVRNFTTSDTLFFEKYRTGLLEITYVWKNDFKDFQNFINCDQCFQLCMLINVPGGDAVYTFSNCFIRKCSDCFTSLLEYSNEEDYGGFDYCTTGLINRVRLPLYLTNPRVIEDKSVYRKSNGVIKQLKSLITKEYEVLTEYFPENIHDKLSVALAHDLVNIASERYAGVISKSSEYSIDWQENLCQAPASLKVTASPYAVRNNNCDTCGDCRVELANVDIVNTGGSPVTYTVTWINIYGTPASVQLSFSLDGGATWNAVLGGAVINDHQQDYTLELADDTDYLLKLTPTCTNSEVGTPVIKSYTV